MVHDRLTEIYMYEKMKSGDLVVFGGTDPLSDVISGVTDSPYTHVGIVLLVKGKVCILESIIENSTEDALSQHKQGGVVVRELKTIVEQSRRAAHAETVWWAPRTSPLTQEQEDKLTLFALDIQGTPYDFLQALTAPMDGLDHLVTARCDPKERLFCSELVVVCELAVTGMVYHHNHKVPINASTVVPREVVELHVAGVPIWGKMVAL